MRRLDIISEDDSIIYGSIWIFGLHTGFFRVFEGDSNVLYATWLSDGTVCVKAINLSKQESDLAKLEAWIEKKKMTQMIFLL